MFSVGDEKTGIVAAVVENLECQHGEIPDFEGVLFVDCHMVVFDAV